MICSTCSEDKPASHFNGSRKQCRECRTKYEREWRARPLNRQKGVAATLRWAAKNPDKIFIYQMNAVLKQYGMTYEDYRRMFNEQDGRCAICGQEPSGKHRLHVDHNHETGQVRGLLCNTCNNGLGKFKDNPELLAAAIVYLESHGV